MGFHVLHKINYNFCRYGLTVQSLHDVNLLFFHTHKLKLFITDFLM